MHIPTLLCISLLLTTTHITSMENFNTMQAPSSALITLPVDASVAIIAHCLSKNTLRVTCKYFCDLASRRKNEDILTQPLLQLSQEALDRYLLYYGSLGNKAIVCNLLNKGANPNSCEDNGIALIHYAMQYGYSDIAKILLSHPAFITSTIMDNQCYRFLPAVQSTQLHIMDHMLSICTISNTDALEYAVKNGLYNRVQALLTQGVKPNPNLLLFAADKTHINIMQLLLKHGTSVNAVANNTFPILIAAERGYTSMVQLLIDHNADCNPYNPHGSALHYAAGEGHINTIKILLDNHADVHKKIYGDTPLHNATESGHDTTIELLLKNGAQINEKNSDNGNTALHIASEKGYINIVTILLNHKAGINEKNSKGYTPLLRATIHERTKIVGILLAHGANVHEKDSYGYTPLQQAALYGFVSIIQLLLDYGADIHEKDTCDKTSPDVAKDENIKEFLRTHKKNMSHMSGADNCAIQ